jgi:hypothetical protein
MTHPRWRGIAIARGLTRGEVRQLARDVPGDGARRLAVAIEVEVRHVDGCRVAWRWPVYVVREGRQETRLVSWYAEEMTDDLIVRLVKIHRAQRRPAPEWTGLRPVVRCPAIMSQP